jgi:hypothetical protein
MTFDPAAFASAVRAATDAPSSRIGVVGRVLDSRLGRVTDSFADDTRAAWREDAAACGLQVDADGIPVVARRGRRRR